MPKGKQRARSWCGCMLLVLLLIANQAHAQETEDYEDTTEETSSSALKRDTSGREEYDYDDDDKGSVYDGREVYLDRTVMRNMSCVSGERLQIKFKVDGHPNNNMKYDWYFGNTIYVRGNVKVIDDQRVTVSNKSTVSKLKISHVTTADSGWYRAEAYNGYRRVQSRTYVKISFKKAPPHKPILPKGKCEMYSGAACKDLLDGRRVFVDPFQPQAQAEKEISTALHVLGDKDNKVSSKCKRYAYNAFCYFVFPPCEESSTSSTGGRPDAYVPLCRRDCEAMKFDVCEDELLLSMSNQKLKLIFETTDCSHLSNDRCTDLQLPKTNHNCYNNTGTQYRGQASFANSGASCVTWPENMATKYPSLAGGHNFCRNPGTARDSPWCFTDDAHRIKETCTLPKCVQWTVATDSPNLALIIVPSICVPFIIGCVAFAVCFCRRNNENKAKGGSPGNRNSNNKNSDNSNTDRSNGADGSQPTSNSTSVTFKKQPWRVAELNASSVLLIDEMGEGQFGKVYRANIIPNPVFCTNLTVAVKTLADVSYTSQEEDFHREISIFSELQHENIACLKAIVMQPSLRCMVFEYTAMGDLHEFVVLRSPQSDFVQPPPGGASSQASSLIEPGDFIHMATQVACGMDYLTSKNFVHRDLAARNVLVGPNNQMKISNLAIVRDPYLSCYYRSPQGGQMLPIRWMAPESLQSWQFSDKSAVWSYGVLLWEMFSYGMQPYCGYSNHEVLEMIGRRQLLDCPDQCPAKVYSLMFECWCGQPIQRPTFKELLAKLQGWEQQNATRMTSQLVQGIHRQLPTALRDSGNGQFTNYQQANNGISFNSNVPTNFNGQLSNQSQHVGNFTFHNNQQPAPYSNSYMTSQQSSSPSFASSPGAYAPSPSVFPPAYNQQQRQQQQQQQQQQNALSDGPFQNGASLFNDRRQMTHQQHQQPAQQQQVYRPGPPSHSSITSSASSSRSARNNAVQQQQQRPPHDYRPDTGGVLANGVGNGYPFAAHPQRPLSDVAENVDDNDAALANKGNDSDFQTSAENEALITKNGGNEKVKPPVKQGRYRGDSSDVSTISFKATSCDSGLPAEDVVDQVNDARTPLMGGGRAARGAADVTKTPQTMRKPV